MGTSGVPAHLPSDCQDWSLQCRREPEAPEGLQWLLKPLEVLISAQKPGSKTIKKNNMAKAHFSPLKKVFTSHQYEAGALFPLDSFYDVWAGQKQE